MHHAYFIVETAQSGAMSKDAIGLDTKESAAKEILRHYRLGSIREGEVWDENDNVVLTWAQIRTMSET